MDFGVATVAAIVVISFLVGQAAKATSLDNKWIPIVCGVAGLILGLVSYWLQIPDMPASDPITAAAIGVASGFAATGVNQVYKQLSKDNEVEADN